MLLPEISQRIFDRGVDKILHNYSWEFYSIGVFITGDLVNGHSNNAEEINEARDILSWKKSYGHTYKHGAEEGEWRNRNQKGAKLESRIVNIENVFRQLERKQKFRSIFL